MQLLPELREPQERSLEELREAIKQQEDALYKAEQDVLEQILPEAFACVREASRRTIGLRHYDVQVLGGMVLHRGRIVYDGRSEALKADPARLEQLIGVAGR